MTESSLFDKVNNYRELLNVTFSNAPNMSRTRIFRMDLIDNDTPSPDIHIRYPSGKEIILFPEEDHITVSRYISAQLLPKTTNEPDAAIKCLFLHDELTITENEDGTIPGLVDLLCWGLSIEDLEDEHVESIDSVNGFITIRDVSNYNPKDGPKPYTLYKGIVKSTKFRKMANSHLYMVDITFEGDIKFKVHSISASALDKIKKGATIHVNEVGAAIRFMSN